MQYQVTCPKCHYEWHYDNTYYDDKITQLGVEIAEISLQLQKHNLKPQIEQYALTDWWRQAKRALAIKQKDLAELKAIRKIYNQEVNRNITGFFKQLVKEEIGEQKYLELCELAEKEAAAYKIEGLMKCNYTISNSKTKTTNINKL